MSSKKKKTLLLIAETRLEYEAYAAIIRHTDASLGIRCSGFELASICDELRAAPAVTIVVAERVTMDVRAIVGLIAKLLPSTRILLIVGAVVDSATRTSLLTIVTNILEKHAIDTEGLVQTIHSVMRGEIVSNLAGSSLRPLVSLAKASQEQVALSPREKDLLPLLASGLKLREAADKLKISYKTADAYRTKIFQKLNISNRSELIRFAIRNSMISA